ncbi:MAG: imidazole glycerol phosphate synthase subunit HisH [Clostridiales Family XIII bacterium]|jgi:glutamine amidotransferase|nr:imidazole glycerol phosphate synthase subunit HisH [Clostridiales Family XIII bacterium]
MQTQKIAIIDYGAGNLFSVKNALAFLGYENASFVSAPDALSDADKLILPGVGAFPDAMRMLAERGLIGAIKAEAQKKPLLGICLGMQILFEKGYEFGETDGLALIPGYVDRIEAPGLKIPHMGWDEVCVVNPSPMAEGLPPATRVYFVHSYKAVTDEKHISLKTAYGQLIPALVRGGGQGQIYGAQFHPEKSGPAGLGILRRFLELPAVRADGSVGASASPPLAPRAPI